MFHSSRGAYNPVISDGQTIFLVGYASVAAFVPKTVAQERRAAARRKAAAKKKREARKKRRAAKKKRRAKKRRERRD